VPQILKAFKPKINYVWTLALRPDFKKGLRVTEKVQRRDLTPTITYLMSGESDGRAGRPGASGSGG